jgi:ABC-type nitrate/sulfonate/bicarbonate transport system permease component
MAANPTSSETAELALGGGATAGEVAATRQPDLTTAGTAPIVGGPGAIRRIAGTRAFIAVRSFAIFIGLWQLLALWNANPIRLPAPFQVATALVNLSANGELFEHARISTTRLVISLVIATILAVPLGLLMGSSRKAEAIIDPLVELLRPISGIAWIPIGVFLFGVGDTLPVFIMVYVAFFPLLLNTVAGVRDVDRRLLNAARTMGVSRTAMLRRVIVPAALPTIMVGFRIAFASAWAAIIAAELIGAPSGLGFAIEWYRQLLMSPKVFAFIAVIGLVGYLCDLALRALQRRLTPWAEGMGLT